MQDRAGGPAIMLMVSGIVGLVYSVIYLAWTFMPVAFGIFGVVAQINDKGFSGDTVGVGLVYLVIPILQVLGYALCTALAAIALWGGLKFQRFESKGLVFVALASSTAVPVLGLVNTNASALNCSSWGACGMGCLLGNVGTLPVLIVGLIATIWGIVALTGPMGDRFEDA